MHSVAPYIIKTHDPRLPGPLSERYSNLNRIGSFDLFVLLKDFIESHRASYTKVDEDQQIYCFDEVHYDSDTRIIYGNFKVGSYGSRSEIIDIKTNQVSFEKVKNHADVLTHFFSIYLPANCQKGIVLMHAYRNIGVKTLFSNEFGEYFTAITKQVLNFEALSYEKAMSNWLDGAVKEIRLIRYSKPRDLADQLLGDTKDVTLVYKANRKRDYGYFRDFLSDGRSYEAVTLMSGSCEQIKVQVDVAGRKRMFNIGFNSANAICDIDIPNDLIKEDGALDFAKLVAWCAQLTSEFAEALLLRPREE